MMNLHRLQRTIEIISRCMILHFPKNNRSCILQLSRQSMQYYVVEWSLAILSDCFFLWFFSCPAGLADRHRMAVGIWEKFRQRVFFPKKSSSISDSRNEPFSLLPPSLSPLSGGLVTSTPLPPPISTCAEHHQSPTMPYSFEHLHTHKKSESRKEKYWNTFVFLLMLSTSPLHAMIVSWFFTCWYMVWR